MKITHIGHAAILIETDGLRIISDPWWQGPCFGAQWWVYPPPVISPILSAPLDYIYISHGHADHYHRPTLGTLDRTATVLVSEELDLADSIENMGFNVLKVRAEDEIDLAEEVSCRIVPTHGGDTFFSLSTRDEVCLNLNDALHSAPETIQRRIIQKLHTYYPHIDYVFCGYGVASHFPNCYTIPEKDQEKTAALRQSYFNHQWAKIVHQLKPKFAFPFAADVVLLQDELFWANEPTQNTERPIDVFKSQYPSTSTEVIDIAPGFVIEDGVVRSEKLRQRLDIDQLRDRYASAIEMTNSDDPISFSGVEVAANLIRKNIDICQEYLAHGPDSYRFVIRLRGSQLGLVIDKTLKDFAVRTSDSIEDIDDFDVRYTTRLPYLRGSLTRRYGDEVLFVGSGGVFEYASRARGRLDLHREFIVMLRLHESPPRRDGVYKMPWLSKMKRVVKRIVGRREDDLYDLVRWTVFTA